LASDVKLAASQLLDVTAKASADTWVVLSDKVLAMAENGMARARALAAHTALSRERLIRSIMLDSIAWFGKPQLDQPSCPLCAGFVSKPTHTHYRRDTMHAQTA
jgi:hypothetical protein